MVFIICGIYVRFIINPPSGGIVSSHHFPGCIYKCSVHLADIRYWDVINSIYKDFFKDHTPARIVVPCQGLHFGCLVEIEAIAEITER